MRAVHERSSVCTRAGGRYWHHEVRVGWCTRPEVKLVLGGGCAWHAGWRPHPDNVMASGWAGIRVVQVGCVVC